MSDGLKLLSAAIAAGSAASLVEMGLDMFEAGEVEPVEFALRHRRTYRELPTAQTIREETGVTLPTVREPLQFYIDKVYDRSLFNEIRENFPGLREGVSRMDVEAMTASISAMNAATRRGNRRGKEALQIDEAMGLVFDRIDRTRGQGGITGVTTGMPRYDTITGGYQRGDLISIVARMGVGKCMDPETPVILANGAIRPIGTLLPGDTLMGPDSQPRTVLTTTAGRDPMYRITPAYGDSWVCNGAHILVCVMDSTIDRIHTKGSTYQYSVDDYLKLPSRVKDNLRLIRVSVDMPEVDVEVSPYYLGLWLGDGCVVNGRISTIDPEIKQAVYEEAALHGMTVTQCEYRQGFCPSYALVNGSNKDHLVIDFFRTCYVRGEKRVHPSYLRNSRANRLQVLAGIIDTDGHYMEKSSTYEVITKYPGLRDDIAYLARSVGLGVSLKQKTVDGKVYQRVYIRGDLHIVPCRLPRKQAPIRTKRSNALHSPFTVSSEGEGEYFGITLDKDHLYLLGDFTVTHNTYVALKQAVAAHDSGENVLFVTTEMSIEQIARRHISIAMGINPDVLKRNTLSTYTERRIRRFYRDRLGSERFNIFSVGMNSQVAAVEAFMQEFDPSVVFIDGVYLMKPSSTSVSKSSSRTEKVTAVFDELKGLTLDADRPLIVTTQLNRQAGKGGKEGSLETIGYSDAIGTHSSIVVAVKYGPTENPRDSREFDFLKGREGEDGKVAINFKFAPLDMSEIDMETLRAMNGGSPGSENGHNLDWMST